MATVIEGVVEQGTSQSVATEQGKTKARSRSKGKGAEASQEVEQAQPTAAVEPASVANGTPANQQEPYFNRARGGYEALTPNQKAQANEAYAKWAVKNPSAAEKQGVEGYCAFRQKMDAEREVAAQRDAEQTGKEAGAPSEKSWRRQRGGIEKLDETQKAQALADFQKAAAENPKTAQHGFESFVSFVQDRCREDFALGAAARRAYQNVDKGAVNMVDDKLTRKFMESAYDGKSTGNDALRVLQPSVEPGQAKTQQFKNMFSVEVQRSADNAIVRTTVIPAQGKEAEVKQTFDKIARQAFSRSGKERSQEPKQQQRETKQHTNDVGR
jgi:hypothetical protein